MKKLLLALGLLLLGAFGSGEAYACNVPNPNLLAGDGVHSFADGCPVPAAALNRILSTFSNTINVPGIDPRLFGATCGSGDSSAGIQAALNSAAIAGSPLGGTVLIPCPMTATTGNINIYAGTRFWGNGPGSGSKGQSQIPGPSTWPPTLGGSVNCPGVTNPCFNIVGEGVDIGYLLVGNPEPVPPSGGSYAPSVFPYIFSAACGANWQSLHMHDITFVSAYNGIDLEGCANYSSNNSGGSSVIERVWFNVVLNNAIKAHLIDYTPLRIRDIEGWSDWYYNVASLGAYVRANLKFFDIEYCAACMISGVETPPARYGIWFDNGTVSNPGTVTLAYTGTMTQMHFNNSCQAIAASNTALSLWLTITDSNIWGDQSSFQCSKGLPMIQLPSNLVYLSLNGVDATAIDTLTEVGCGTPSSGSCPPGGFAGQSYLRLTDLFVNTYATNTSTAPLLQVPANAILSMQNTDPLELIPANGSTGKLIGPGFDSTTGCDRPVQVGGGINQSYNAATLNDSCGLASTISGGAQFLVGSTLVGSVGYGTVAGGVNLSSVKSIFLNPGGATGIVNNVDGSLSLVSKLFAALPTCNSGESGAIYRVPDVNTATPSITWGAVINTGGGSNQVIAVCNGANWIIH